MVFKTILNEIRFLQADNRAILYGRNVRKELWPLEAGNVSEENGLKLKDNFGNDRNELLKQKKSYG